MIRVIFVIILWFAFLQPSSAQIFIFNGYEQIDPVPVPSPTPRPTPLASLEIQSIGLEGATHIAYHRDFSSPFVDRLAVYVPTSAQVKSVLLGLGGILNTYNFFSGLGFDVADHDLGDSPIFIWRTANTATDIAGWYAQNYGDPLLQLYDQFDFGLCSENLLGSSVTQVQMVETAAGTILFDQVTQKILFSFMFSIDPAMDCFFEQDVGKEVTALTADASSHYYYATGNKIYQKEVFSPGISTMVSLGQNVNVTALASDATTIFFYNANTDRIFGKTLDSTEKKYTVFTRNQLINLTGAVDPHVSDMDIRLDPITQKVDILYVMESETGAVIKLDFP